MRYFSVLLLVVGCFSCSVAPTERSVISTGIPALSAPFNVATIDQFSGNVPLQNTDPSTPTIYANTYQINFGPQRVTVRAAYREDANQKSQINGSRKTDDIHGYFDLRATSALAGTSLIAESEMIYGVLNPFEGNIRPEMLRFGLKNRWRNFSYGADYKSIAKGLTPIAGTVADQSRDEALIWGEHGFGPLKVRGSISESWERVLGSADLRVTRTAATVFDINRAGWGGSFSTSYGLIGVGSGANQENVLFVKRLTTSFRQSDFLLLEPNFSVTEEWNQSTGVRTQTPTSGLSFTYSPLRGAFRLTGGTSFSRIFDREGSNDVRIHGTSAVVDWKLGKFLGRDDILSFTFNYQRHLDHVLRSNSHGALWSMLQFKIAGF